MNKNQRKSSFSKKILALLAQKPALAVPELVATLGTIESSQKEFYAITRSIKGLEETGLIQHSFSGQNQYARLTKEGKKKVHSIALEHDTTLVHTTWDQKWRVILLDVPEARKDEREALRYLLKKAGFQCVKNSVWVSPMPYEYFFGNIKKDFGLSTELMIFVTDTLDPETEQAFLSLGK